MALNVYPKDQALRDLGDVAVAVHEFLKSHFERVPVAVLYEALGRVREHLVRSFADANCGDPEFDIRVGELRDRLDPEGRQRRREEWAFHYQKKMARTWVEEIARVIREEIARVIREEIAAPEDDGKAGAPSTNEVTDATSPTPKSPEA